MLVKGEEVVYAYHGTLQIPECDWGSYSLFSCDVIIFQN